MAAHCPPIFGVLLPTTKYILNLKSPPAREMIAKGVPVALGRIKPENMTLTSSHLGVGSDFNPNAHCLSMPLTMHMACVLMKMTMAEALVASTINAAGSINRGDKYG